MSGKVKKHNTNHRQFIHRRYFINMTKEKIDRMKRKQRDVSSAYFIVFHLYFCHTLPYFAIPHGPLLVLYRTLPYFPSFIDLYSYFTVLYFTSSTSTRISPFFVFPHRFLSCSIRSSPQCKSICLKYWSHFFSPLLLYSSHMSANV
jgi:hypothetical protein